MRIVLLDRGHWHAAMHRAAFAACGHEVQVVQEQGAEVLDRLLADPPEPLILLGKPQEMLHDLRRCIEAGVSVAVEKPVGTRAGELAPLVALVEERGAFVSVAQPHLLNDFWQHCTEQAGGPLSHLRFRLVNGPPQRYVRWNVPWVLDAEQAGGGVLRNLGIHGVSAFLHATQGEARVHSCLLSRRLYGLEVEEYASLSLSAGGVIGQIEVGYTAALDSASEFELSGHRLGLSVRDDGDRLTVLDRVAGEGRELPTLPLARRYEQFAAATLRALADRQPPPHSLSDHLRAMRLIDDAYAKASWVTP